MGGKRTVEMTRTRGKAVCVCVCVCYEKGGGALHCQYFSGRKAPFSGRRNHLSFLTSNFPLLVAFSGCLVLPWGFLPLVNLDEGFQVPVRYSFETTSTTHKTMANNVFWASVKFRSSIMFANKLNLRRFRIGSGMVRLIAYSQLR